MIAPTDCSKIGRTGRAYVGPPTIVQAVVTAPTADPAVLAALGEAGIDVAACPAVPHARGSRHLWTADDDRRRDRSGGQESGEVRRCGHPVEGRVERIADRGVR